LFSLLKKLNRISSGKTDAMLFYNLNKPSEKVDFKTATILGLGSEKGLFFPERIPALSKTWIRQLENFSDEEIGFNAELCGRFYSGRTPDAYYI
jgi:threonine synthase